MLEALDRFLDPIIAVRTPEGRYWTPNGNHRLASMRALGARSIVALVLPEPEVAYKILALNTEKAHNLREKSLEVDPHGARSRAARTTETEKDYALEFEEAAFLTLGVCYEQNGRFAGGAYHPLLKRIDAFLARPLSKALEVRKERADAVLELDAAVVAAMAALKERGFESPYLRPFVVARINPIRFHKGAQARVRRNDREDARVRPEVQGRGRQARAARPRRRAPPRSDSGTAARRTSCGSPAPSPWASSPPCFASRVAAQGSKPPDLATATVVDLTHAFDEKTIYWPTSPSAFELKSLAYGPTPGGWFYSSNTFCTPEHGGTHLDAPIHFAKRRPDRGPHSRAAADRAGRRPRRPREELAPIPTTA